MSTLRRLEPSGAKGAVSYILFTVSQVWVALTLEMTLRSINFCIHLLGNLGSMSSQTFYINSFVTITSFCWESWINPRMNEGRWTTGFDILIWAFCASESRTKCLVLWSTSRQTGAVPLARGKMKWVNSVAIGGRHGYTAWQRFFWETVRSLAGTCHFWISWVLFWGWLAFVPKTQGFFQRTAAINDDLKMTTN